MNTNSILLFSGVLALANFTVGCDSKQEEAREAAVERKADNLEERADKIRENAEAAADKVENKADALEERADEVRDRE